MQSEMTKKELIAAIPEAQEMGLSIAPLMLLDIFEDDEEIPEEFVRVFLRVPEEPQPITIMMGIGMAEKINDLMKNYIDNLSKSPLTHKDRTKLLAVLQKWEHLN